MSEEPTEQVWSRIPAELATELEVECAKRRLKRPAAIKQAIEAWLKRGQGTGEQFPKDSPAKDSVNPASDTTKCPQWYASITEEEREQHEKLHYLHTSGVQDAIDAVTKNIDYFEFSARVIRKETGLEGKLVALPVDVDITPEELQRLVRELRKRKGSPPAGGKRSRRAANH